MKLRQAAILAALLLTTALVLGSLGAPAPGRPRIVREQAVERPPAEPPAGRCEDLLAALPPWPRQRSEAAPDGPVVTPLGPGVAVALAAPCAVLFSGSIAVQSGPQDHGLETLASLAGGRMHESLIALDLDDAILAKSACLAAFGLGDGSGSAEGDELPARGIPLRVQVRWQDDDGRHRITDASCLLRDRILDRGMPPLPYVWTGSRMASATVGDGKGGFRERPMLLLAASRVLIANEDADGALLASVLPPSANQMRYEVNTALAPMLGQPVGLLITRAELPLTLRLLADGGFADHAGRPLDQGGLLLFLAEAFARPAPGRLQAVRVLVDAACPRAGDPAARRRLMLAAARLGLWCLPVFQPADMETEVPR